MTPPADVTRLYGDIIDKQTILSASNLDMYWQTFKDLGHGKFSNSITSNILGQ